MAPLTSSDSADVSVSISLLEQLPSEILWYLSRFLDLTSIIVLSTAVSRTLTGSYRQFARHSLFLEPLHRLDLSEWRDTANALEFLGLTRSTLKTVKPDPNEVENLRQTCQILSKDDSLVDLHLLQDALVYLQGSRLTTVMSSAKMPRLHSLCLLGWHGIAGSFLISQLRTNPLLIGIRTIFKTERADSRIWLQLAIDGQRKALEPYEQISIMRKAREDARSQPTIRVQGLRPQAATSTSPFSFKACYKTQAIVQVGRRRPRQEGQAYLKGEGLQIGYESYCLTMTPSPGNKPETLHVILQGREMPDSKTSNDTAYMLERSVITCNHCKERIVF